MVGNIPVSSAGWEKCKGGPVVNGCKAQALDGPPGDKRGGSLERRVVVGRSTIFSGRAHDATFVAEVTAPAGLSENQGTSYQRKTLRARDNLRGGSRPRRCHDIRRRSRFFGDWVNDRAFPRPCNLGFGLPGEVPIRQVPRDRHRTCLCSHERPDGSFPARIRPGVGGFQIGPRISALLGITTASQHSSANP